MGPCEIIVTVRGDLSPRSVEFSDLYALKDSLQSIMFLWDTNSYYVDAVSKTFIVNGGRRTRFNELGPCGIIYRRRNRLDVSLSGEASGSPRVFYLVGIKELSSDRSVFLTISENGTSWKWGKEL